MSEAAGDGWDVEARGQTGESPGFRSEVRDSDSRQPDLSVVIWVRSDNRVDRGAAVQTSKPRLLVGRDVGPDQQARDVSSRQLHERPEPHDLEHMNSAACADRVHPACPFPVGSLSAVCRASPRIVAMTRYRRCPRARYVGAKSPKPGRWPGLRCWYAPWDLNPEPAD